jgi:hypothetical protein
LHFKAPGDFRKSVSGKFSLISNNITPQISFHGKLKKVQQLILPDKITGIRQLIFPDNREKEWL